MKGISNNEADTIIDQNGQALSDESGLQFTDGLKATDDIDHDKIVVGVDTVFTESSTRTNISSGDSLATIFGKIKKFFSDLKTVAFTNSYNDLNNKPTIGDGTLTIQKNGTDVASFTANQTGNSTANLNIPVALSELSTDTAHRTVTDDEKTTWNNKSTFSGSYNDLTDKPTIGNGTLTITKGTNNTTFTANQTGNSSVSIPTKTSELTNDSNYPSDASYVHTDNNYTTTEKNKLSGIAAGAEVNVQSNWLQTNDTADDFIKNKPNIPVVNNATLTIQKNGSNVATFTANASSNVTANIEVPTNNNQLTNGAGYITSSGSCNYATSAGSANSVAWSNVTGKPTIPAAANNGTLTIQKNGTNVATFTANQSGNTTCNITVPTNTNELTNGAGYITSSGSCNYATSAGSAVDATAREKANNALPKSGGNMDNGAVIRLVKDNKIRVALADSVMLYASNGSTNGYIINSTAASASIDINSDTTSFYQVNQAGQTKTIFQLYASGNDSYLNSQRNYLKLIASSAVQCQNNSGGWVNIDAANVSSSLRFKENIKDITEDDAKKLLDVRPITFDFKGKYAPNERERYGQSGVIAEELNEIYPNLVRYSAIDTEDGEEVPTFVEYSHFVPYLIKMIQMQEKKINRLEKVIEELSNNK